jgi:UDP-GlcNAc:undecaprenyl-phosphate/decaprenyl-phosphate GlcNAc-1-phosphate transferase
MFYFFVILASILLSFVLTFFILKVAKATGVVDEPDNKRKFHGQAIPLLGGLAIFFCFFLILFFTRSNLLAGNLEPRHWIGFFIGGGILMIGGFFDDKYKISPGKQFIFPLLATLAVVAGGVEIAKISSPLGGHIMLNSLKIPVLYFGGAWHYFMVVSDMFILFWLLGMMYTTKLLDGLDGLVSGITAIGSLVIFLFTMTTRYYQPDIGLAALALGGACLGFLVFNWHPAKVFLGEGGSLFLGYALGVLAIISGGKIAIALLIMGIPILDVLWTIIRRASAGHNPFRISDRKHLHFRLHDSGLGTRKTVLIFYALATVFGLSGLFLQSAGKLFSLLVLAVIMMGVVVAFSWAEKR